MLAMPAAVVTTAAVARPRTATAALICHSNLRLDAAVGRLRATDRLRAWALYQWCTGYAGVLRGQDPAVDRLLDDLTGTLDALAGNGEWEATHAEVRGLTAALAATPLDGFTPSLDPAAGLRQARFTVSWLLAGLDDAERAEVLATGPRGTAALWRLGRSRYARLVTDAFGEGAR